MAIENWVAEELESLVAFRRDLHQNPELLYDVHRTAEHVAEALRAAGVDEVTTGVGKTGVVGVIRGQSNRSGRAIALRADLDALPILEESGKAWSSLTPGKMHACGHDGHTTMLLGAAKGLAESRAFDGTVILVFQPAEEGGAGAQAMIDDGLFTRWHVDEVYGMHNRPGLPVGQFTIGSGPIMGSVDEIRITVTGVGSHAAEPHNGVDPMPVTASIILAAQSIASRAVDPMDAVAVSITTIHGGQAFNIIPQEIRMTGTVRTLREGVRDRVEVRLREVVERTAEAYGATAQLEYIRMYPVTVNHSAQTEYAAIAAASVVGDDHSHRNMPPMLGGEDLAFMLNEKPGAMIMIGNGASAQLHHPKYDFDDDALAYGCSYWAALVKQRLPVS